MNKKLYDLLITSGADIPTATDLAIHTKSKPALLELVAYHSRRVERLNHLPTRLNSSQQLQASRDVAEYCLKLVRS